MGTLSVPKQEGRIG